ncbi:MAG: hypothetical protein M1533_05500 [Candidatus Thermoplasmatota archaeon]|nr:hypothetical protein [Candidatus Thermoplasmatota archaeon]MCL5793703.1 hypothetical protein [Candidatus Thermoplasmatota archaeon]
MKKIKTQGKYSYYKLVDEKRINGKFRLRFPVLPQAPELLPCKNGGRERFTSYYSLF